VFRRYPRPVSLKLVIRRVSRRRLESSSSVTSTAQSSPSQWLRTGCRPGTRTFIGLRSFGGPAVQIALMERVLVLEEDRIGEGRFLHALNHCTLLPDPEARRLADCAGWLLRRTVGGLAAEILPVQERWFSSRAAAVTSRSAHPVLGAFSGRERSARIAACSNARRFRWPDPSSRRSSSSSPR